MRNIKTCLSFEMSALSLPKYEKGTYRKKKITKRTHPKNCVPKWMECDQVYMNSVFGLTDSEKEPKSLLIIKYKSNNLII